MGHTPAGEREDINWRKYSGISYGKPVLDFSDNPEDKQTEKDDSSNQIIESEETDADFDVGFSSGSALDAYERGSRIYATLRGSNDEIEFITLPAPEEVRGLLDHETAVNIEEKAKYGRLDIPLDFLCESETTELTNAAELISYKDVAKVVHENTVLYEQQARVYTLRELFGLSRSEVADVLGILPNSVDNHRQQINSNIRKSQRTVDNLTLI